MSQSIKDKIVNHFVANYYLTSYLSCKLIDQNVATRKGYGTHKALKYVKDYLNTLIMKNTGCDIYCLKLDIKKYFYNIDHNILINMLSNDIKDVNVINIIKNIINETNKDYVNKFVSIYNSNFNLDIPYYAKNVGLSIGAQSSQFLAIYFLNKIDHYIKEELHCKFFTRYQDDFVIFDNDKNRLKYIWNCIYNKLKNLKLDLNKKSNIYNMKNGINFLGYNYKIKYNKLIINYNKKTYRRINHRLKYLRINDIDKYHKSYASYYGYFKYINKRTKEVFKMDIKEKYKMLKEKYYNYVVIIKDKVFYYSYNDDAKILWNILRYKYKDDYSLSFGTGAYHNVIDALDKAGLNYIIYEDAENVVMNDKTNKVYELILELSNINYDRYIEEKELKELFVKVLKSGKYQVVDLKAQLLNILED